MTLFKKILPDKLGEKVSWMKFEIIPIAFREGERSDRPSSGGSGLEAAGS